MANDLSNEIKEVWEDGLQDQLREKFVGFNFANTKMDGRFVWADTVHFTRQTKIEVQNLASFNDSIVLQDLDSTDETFSLTERRYFAFTINIEEDIETYVDPRSQALVDVMESFNREYDKQIFLEYANAGYVFDDGDVDTATNGGAGFPIILSKDNIIGVLININTLMDDNLIAGNDRKIALKPKDIALFLKSPELTRATETAERRLETGLIWELEWFNIYKTLQLAEVTGTRHSLAVQWKPISFGSNIKPNVYVSTVSENTDKFASIVKWASKFGTKLYTEGAEKTVDVQIKV